MGKGVINYNPEVEKVSSTTIQKCFRKAGMLDHDFSVTKRASALDHDPFEDLNEDSSDFTGSYKSGSTRECLFCRGICQW